MKSLTAKQQAIWDLRESGKTYKEIAAELGISYRVVHRTIFACKGKLGQRNSPGERDREGHKALQVRDPELAAAAIDAMTDPLHKVKEALVLAGLSNAVSDSVLRRLKVKFFGAVMEVKALKTQEIVRVIEEKLDMIRFYLDDKVMAEASARDLMLGMGVLVEKRQLLRGEPTQIISDLERKRLHELLPLAIAEAQRRGLIIPGQVLEKTVGPV